VEVRVAIVGCGLIGAKRARALGPARLVAAVDVDHERAKNVAAPHADCTAGTDWRAAVARPDVDLLVVATTNDALALVTLEAVRHGKHVLVEKPAARHTSELRPVLNAARKADVVVKVGFNHRFHPAPRKAHEIFTRGEIGPLLYIRARYGHGGRPGYDREWRADPAISGGGELLDQGVHLVDLARWFAGDFADIRGHTERYFWDMPVEDNGFLVLRTPRGQTAWLHASCTEWKNLFSFEVFGRQGKLQIDGLGGSYGVERLTFYRMLPQMGPPETTIWEYPGEDQSWQAEFVHLLDCIAHRKPLLGSLEDALRALEIVERVYEQERCEARDPAVTHPTLRRAV
jgi:predicted dehydrogenase